MRGLRDKWAKIPFERKLMILVPVLLALIGVVGTSLRLLLSGSEETRPVGADLEVIDMAVEGGAPRGDPAAIQRLDLTVRNSGEVSSVVKGIGFRVKDSVLLKICQAGGGLEPSRAYKVLLPPDPAVGEVVTKRLSQQIGPGKPDRFTVGFDLPEPARQLGDYLYQLEVLLYHDTAADPIELGTILVSAPYLPTDDFFWSGQSEPRSAQWGGPESPVWRCFDENEADFKRMLALEGKRSPQLSTALLQAS